MGEDVDVVKAMIGVWADLPNNTVKRMGLLNIRDELESYGLTDAEEADFRTEIDGILKAMNPEGLGRDEIAVCKGVQYHCDDCGLLLCGKCALRHFDMGHVIRVDYDYYSEGKMDEFWCDECGGYEEKEKLTTEQPLIKPTTTEPKLVSEIRVKAKSASEARNKISNALRDANWREKYDITYTYTQEAEKFKDEVFVATAEIRVRAIDIEEAKHKIPKALSDETWRRKYDILYTYTTTTEPKITASMEKTIEVPNDYEVKTIEILTTLKANPDGLSDVLEEELSPEMKTKIANVIRARMERKGALEAMDFEREIGYCLARCEDKGGIPQLRTRYAGERFEDREHPGRFLVLFVCYGKGWSQWFDNVSIEDIEKLESD